MGAKIAVEGFKSIGDRVEVDVAPLTLLAGANSSGKSSLMQAVLLLKQTIEANYDPGPLLLHGPNVRFTSTDQILHFEPQIGRASGFSVRVQDGEKSMFETRLERESAKQDLAVARFMLRSSGKDYLIEPDSDLEVFRSQMPLDFKNYKIELRSERFWLMPVAIMKEEFRMDMLPMHFRFLQDIIHIPGLRGNPERTYPLTSTGPRFPGTFENYVASLIHHWTSSQKEKVKQLGNDLRRLGLTWKVESKKLDDTTIELRVGRLAKPVKNGANDMVSIADVGFGVSQTLPVLVALLEATRGQLVYIEQPEIHLHPRAQVEMAALLVEASKRGVLVVVETHSSLILLAIQTLVASGTLNSESVMLHWFERDQKTGVTTISSRTVDRAGRFGDWPEDFDDVSLHAQSGYLDAAEHVLSME